jgi:ADP-glucose pyrophosphorylase
MGTVESLWKSTTDLLQDPPRFFLGNVTWDIFTAFRAPSRHHDEKKHRCKVEGCKEN